MPPPALSTTALIASLSIKSLGNRHKDDDLTDEIHRQHDMAKDAGIYQKVRLPEDCLVPLRKIMSAARTDHRTKTFQTPFGAILPAARLDAYNTAMTAWSRQWSAAVQTFITAYPANIARARQILGSAFDLDDYPAQAELPSIFAFETRFLPLPKAEALTELAALGDSRVRQLQEQLRTATDQAAREARQQLLTRLLTRLENVFHMLTADHGRITARTLDNLAELIRIAPDLNLTLDPVITRLTGDITRLLTLSKERLADNPQAIRATTAAAQVLLQPFGLGKRKITAAPAPSKAAAA